jgi:hypothetical protein
MIILTGRPCNLNAGISSSMVNINFKTMLFIILVVS